MGTTGGLTRSGPDIWKPVGRPEYLLQQVHKGLRNLGVEQIDAVADKGYYKGEDIAVCEDVGVVPYVARPQRGLAVASGYFNRTEFRYDSEADCYKSG